MAHVPHLYLPPPWTGGTIPVPPSSLQHLVKVLRRGDGDTVTYTDGAGTGGRGRLGDAGIGRGKESATPAPHPAVTLAVAAPRSADRVRFVVEKLAELGVDGLIWVETRYGGHRVPRPDRSRSWAVAALEQSRGLHLMDVSGPVGIGDIEGPAWLAAPGGGPPSPVEEAVTLIVGPEGGFAPGEVAEEVPRLGLGERILRVETAAVVAATIALQAVGRLPRVDGRGADSSR